MSRSIAVLSTIAGVAWFVGFGQFLLIFADMRLGPPMLALGLAVYGIWALTVGVRLLKRSTPRVLALSTGFAVLSVALNWPGLPEPSLAGPYWLTWLPDATAGVASLIALALIRNGSGARLLRMIVVAAIGALLGAGFGVIPSEGMYQLRQWAETGRWTSSTRGNVGSGRLGERLDNRS